MRRKWLRDLAVVSLISLGALSIPVTFSCYALTQDAGDAQCEQALKTITETELLENVRLLAHKNMEGRGTAKNGWEFPSLFLERELREYGFAPLGKETDEGRSYFQPFRITESRGSRNVLGYLEGQNKDEVLIIGAHYDHEGIQNGSVYHGADDNASGTAAVLEVAEALGELAKKGIKPKRGIVIAFWGAEEEGLLGSAHFVRNLPPEVKLKNIVAALNLDMVGRNANEKLEVLATPARQDFKQACPELHALVHEVNKQPGLKFILWHDDDPAENGFFRTDGYSFYAARPGARIPVMNFFTGFHADYHKPSDTWEKINYPKLTRVAKLAFGILWKLSEAENRPQYR